VPCSSFQKPFFFNKASPPKLGIIKIKSLPEKNIVAIPSLYRSFWLDIYFIVIRAMKYLRPFCFKPYTARPPITVGIIYYARQRI
jgi:hypothetical protein